MSEALRPLTRRERAIVGRARLRQGPVMAAARQVVDAHGAIAAPLVALSTLAVMERNGTITARQRQAGEIFHDHFRRAALGGLKAAALDRVPGGCGGGDRQANGNERARRAVAGAIRALGGEGAIAASCAWHVLGLEWSLRDWAQKAGLRHHLMAGGVLVATLSVLDPYFSA